MVCFQNGHFPLNHLDPPKSGCQMDGSWGAILSNLLGFKHHPLEGAGMIILCLFSWWFCYGFYHSKSPFFHHHLGCFVLTTCSNHHVQANLSCWRKRWWLLEEEGIGMVSKCYQITRCSTTQNQGRYPHLGQSLVVSYSLRPPLWVDRGVLSVTH